MDTRFGMATFLNCSTKPVVLHVNRQATILVCISRPCLAGHFVMFSRLRAYIGFLPVRRTFPNPTHYALATLQHAGVVGPIITQNVDGLHHAALRRISSEPEVDRRILELHGSIFVSLGLYSPPLFPPRHAFPVPKGGCIV